MAYTVKEPYDALEDYTEQEPYTVPVCKDIQVPYSDEECTANRYSYAVENVVKHFWSLSKPYSDVTFDIVNHEDISGIFGYQCDFSNVDGIFTKGLYSATIYANSRKTVNILYDSDFGEDVNIYRPEVFAPVKTECETVTKYKTETECEDVTKYRTVTKTRTVTKYEDVTKYRTEYKYR